MVTPRKTPKGLEVPTRFTVSPHPKGHPDRDKAAVYVEHVEGEGWTIHHPERGRLSRSGAWHQKPAPADLTPEWVDDHRFTFVDAKHRARDLLGIPHPRRF